MNTDSDYMFTDYRKGMDCLHVPDYSMDQLNSAERHAKYLKKKKLRQWVSLLVFAILSGIAASTTVYAAYSMHNSIRFTSQGIRIDADYLHEAQMDSLSHEYRTGEENQQKPLYTQEDFLDTGVPVLDTEILDTEAEIAIEYFDTWEDAFQVIDFPVVYPATISYTDLQIVYTPGNDFKNVEASYLDGERELVVSYTLFSGQNWDYGTDYNAVITDQSVYENRRGDPFWIVECQGNAGSQINVTAKGSQYVLQMSFSGYTVGEVHELLEELDLASSF